MSVHPFIAQSDAIIMTERSVRSVKLKPWHNLNEFNQKPDNSSEKLLTETDLIDFAKRCANNRLIQNFSANDAYVDYAKLLFRPVHYWTKEDYLKVQTMQFAIKQDEFLHTYIREQLKYWVSHLRNKRLYPKLRHERLARHLSFAPDLLTKISTGQTRHYLGHVLYHASLLDRSNLSQSLTQDRLLSHLSNGDAEIFYQLWCHDIIAHKGWLRFQNLIQLGGLAYDLMTLAKKKKTRSLSTSEINQSFSKWLSPLYHCSGRECQEYWMPIFIYLQEYPDPEENTSIKPAHFRKRTTPMAKAHLELFIKNLNSKTINSWIFKFGTSLGLLD